MKNKTTLLLITLALLLAVFAVAAAVCLRLFVWADGASKEDAQADYATFQAQNAAEQIKAAQGDLAKAAQSLGACPVEGGWEAPLENGCRVLLVPQAAPVPYLGQARVAVLAQNGDVLAELTVCWQEDDP